MENFSLDEACSHGVTIKLGDNPLCESLIVYIIHAYFMTRYTQECVHVATRIFIAPTRFRITGRSVRPISIREDRISRKYLAWPGTFSE